MFRREFLKSWVLVTGGAAVATACAPASGPEQKVGQLKAADFVTPDPLPRPTRNKRIPVAFLLSADAEVVDFAGPWGVFEYTFLSDWDELPFELFTVAETAETLTVSGGMKVVPDYTFDSAPQPKVIVIPAQSDPTPGMIAWVQRAAKEADITMSVCTGAYLLAETGLLDGKDATTHHGAMALFAADNPDVRVHRGARFTDSGDIATSGGLTSGIDLALHVVGRYFGVETVEQTILALEYQGQGWKDPTSNQAYAKRPSLTKDPVHCPVCEMKLVDKTKQPTVIYLGKTYYFCSDWCNERFNKSPEYFAEV